MCLFYNAHDTKIIKKQLEESGLIIGYKVVRVYQNNGIYSLYQNYEWEAGLNKSNRPSSKINRIEKEHGIAGGIKLGIHVYLSLESANSVKNIYVNNSIFCNDSAKYKVIEIGCYKEDFVAAGGDCAVFTQVFLSESEYESYLE